MDSSKECENNINTLLDLTASDSTSATFISLSFLDFSFTWEYYVWDEDYQVIFYWGRNRMAFEYSFYFSKFVVKPTIFFGIAIIATVIAITIYIKHKSLS